MALSAHGVTAGYGRRAPCVAHADFQAHAGRVVALIGRNGAGKTTLSRVFAGLHRETAGQVEVCGAPLPARERAGREMCIRDSHHPDGGGVEAAL